MIAVFVGQFGPETEEALRRAAAAAGLPSAFHPDVARAWDDLSAPGAAPPRCIFLEWDLADSPAFVAWLRGEPQLFSVPLVFLVPGLDPLAYGRAHTLGADDVTARHDFDGVRRRLVNLQDFDPEIRPRVSEGIAVLAHPDMGRRRTLGRNLRQFGFDVAFAADASELAAHAAADESPRLAIVAGDLPPDGALEAIRRMRASGNPALPAIVLVPGTNGIRLAGQCQALPSTTTAPDEATPPDLVFLANELLRPDYRELRGAPRLLFLTPCGFRPSGALRGDYGVTYNLSREGLYVRTLVPPPATSQIWFELRPPGAPAAVHLRGRVVWTRRYGTGGGAPPGFGLRMSPETCPPGDLKTYQDCYDALASVSGSSVRGDGLS